MKCKSIILISSSNALHFISLYLIFANSSTPSATQYLSPSLLVLCFLPLPPFASSFVSTSVGWAASEEKKREQEEVDVTVSHYISQPLSGTWTPRSSSRERLGGGDENRLSWKTQPSSQTPASLHCDFTFPVLRLGSGGVNAFERLWNVIAMYAWLREFSAKWTFTGCVYFKRMKVFETRGC